MKLIRLIFARRLRPMDRAIERLTEIRDSYRALNVEIYGEEIAKVLNDW